MKISKLFHWLYAFLMFLPITFILPTLMYYGFNDNATAQEYTKEEPIYYQTNEVNSVDDLTLGNYYTISLNDFVSNNTLQVVFINEYHLIQGNLNYDGIWGTYGNVPYFRTGGASYSNILLATEESDTNNDIYYVLRNGAVIDFLFVSSQDLTTFVDCISSCPRTYVREYQEVTYTMGITDSVNQAIIDTFDLPMFAWATNNILVAPFSSICSFFGVASTSVLIKYLYYWLTISVIWLVFDVLMYIPLLVHNYIDKARIE